MTIHYQMSPNALINPPPLLLLNRGNFVLLLLLTIPFALRCSSASQRRSSFYSAAHNTTLGYYSSLFLFWEGIPINKQNQLHSILLLFHSPITFHGNRSAANNSTVHWLSFSSERFKALKHLHLPLIPSASTLTHTSHLTVRRVQLQVLNHQRRTAGHHLRRNCT